MADLKDVTISTSIPADIAEKIETLAEQMMISKSAVIRQILAAAVREQAEVKEAA